MVIKTENETLFVDLDEVEAIWSDDYRRDHYNVGVGSHTFEVSRPVADKILDAMERRDNEIARILETANSSLQEIGHEAKAAIDVIELRRVLGDVLGQWVADTAGETTNPALYDKAKAMADGRSAATDPPKQVSS